MGYNSMSFQSYLSSDYYSPKSFSSLHTRQVHDYFILYDLVIKKRKNNLGNSSRT